MSRERFSSPPPKTCPRQDKGSRLANCPNLLVSSTERITLGSLSTKHPLGVNVEARKDGVLLHRITSYDQRVTPTTPKPIKPQMLDGNGSRFGGTSEKIRSKHRKRERLLIQRTKGQG